MAARPDTLARKTVTVLFCDVVGSTNLGDRVDPETTRGVMLRYFDETRTVLEHHGGTVEKFIGDAVMAVFGVPLVHEDDALRAVRAADEMRMKLERLNDELERRWGVRLEWRIGINTGEVVVGDPTSTQTIGSGDTFNVAARLQQAARPGQILLGRETHALVRDRISAGPLEAFSLKGKRERIAPWQLERVHERTSGLLRRLDAPFVGREPEREFLDGAYRASVDDETCRLVTVVGPAGIGKSRLVQEFAARLLAAEVLHGRCLPYGEGITFWAVTEIVQDAAGIVVSDSPADARAKIAKLLEGVDDTDLVCERVSSTIGLSAAETRTEEAFWALRRFFEAVARRRPLVLIFEDIHWAEATLLDLIEYLVGWSGGTAILVVCLARPELIDARPAWPGDTVLIEPLSASEIEALAASAVGAGPLDPDVAERIVAAADGNPLFAEEFARMLVDQGLLSKVDGVWTATGDVDEVRMPPTINALLSARLDRLDADEREVLQAASVVGREFWSGSVRELAPHVDGVAQHLHALVRKRLIMPGGSSPIAGEDAFRFTHILVRDAAYGTLAKIRRAQMHERHADWLLEKSGERAPELAEIVGYHLEQAYRAREEIGPVDNDAHAVAQRASELLAAAGRRARDRGDTNAAATLLQRAFVLLDDDRSLVELAPDLGTALSDAGQLTEAEALFSRAIEAAENTGDERARTHAAVGLAHVRVRTNLAGAESELRTAAKEGIETFTRLGDRRGLANALRLLAWTCAADSQLAAMARTLRRAVAEAEAAGDRRQHLTSLQMLAGALYFGPTHTELAISHCEEVLAAAAGHGGVEGAVACYLAGLLAMAGRFQEARDYSSRGTKLLDELGPSVAGGARAAVADAELLTGDARAAEQELTTAYEAATRIGDRMIALSSIYELAAVLCSQDRYEEAEQWAARGRDVVDRVDVMTRVVAFAAEARLATHSGRLDAARSFARRAVELSDRTDASNYRASAWLAAAEVASFDERESDARDAVERALALYAEKGNVAAAAQVTASGRRSSVASSALRRGSGGT